MKSSTLTALLPVLPAAALAASSGCQTPLPPTLTPGSSTYNLTISSKSVIGKTADRQYILHLPSNYKPSNDASTPLILAFHGQSQPAWSMERISSFSNPTFNPNAIVAYPEGLNVQDPGVRLQTHKQQAKPNSPTNAPQVQWLGDPLAPNSTTIDDRLFISELLLHLTTTLCIDTSRIYAAGLSNGGGLTGLLMCDAALNRQFAAFATVAGAFYPDASLSEPLFEAQCAPGLEGRVLPYLNLHGLNDSVVAYDGANTPPPASIPVRSWVDGWARRNACGAPTERVVEGGSVTETKWACARKGDAVVHRAIDGFGHGWPSRAAQGEPFETLRGGPTSWDATQVVVEWFAKWTL